MLKVKIIYFRNTNSEAIEIDINNFLNSLPKKGNEVKDIKYAVDKMGHICRAMISYQEYCDD